MTCSKEIKCSQPCRRVVIGIALCMSAAVVLTGALLYLYRHNPAIGGAYPKCLFYSFTGLWCPGCGLTRGLYACLHGDFVTTIRMNPLMFGVMPALAIVAYAKRRSVCVLKAIDNLVIVSSLIFWLLRNVPCWPFALLSPN